MPTKTAHRVAIAGRGSNTRDDAQIGVFEFQQRTLLNVKFNPGSVVILWELYGA